jgi:hypothetical protein
MPKKNIRQEIKKPDLFVTTFQSSVDWVKNNTKICIIGAVIVVVLGLAGWGYAAYRSNKEDRAQYLLSQGMRSYREYTLGQKNDALAKAEESFNKASREGSAGTADIARLYLARISAVKGMKNQAEAAYNELAAKSSSDVVRNLAQSSLNELKKKP